jgi:hypothetical protein
MPKTLVAISSCQSYEDSGLNQPLRDTWLPEIVKYKMDYKFFHGEGSSSREDVVQIGCNDAYYDLTSKTKLKLQWALSHSYDYVFCCFPDTYVCAERLVICGFEKYDYLGTVFCHPRGNAYCQGGCGYFLSIRAAEIVANDSRNYSNEDCFVADILKGAGILPVHHEGFRYSGPGPLRTNNVVANHLSTQPGGYTATSMLREHENWIKS